VVIQSDLIQSRRVLLAGCTSTAGEDRPPFWPRISPSTGNGLETVSDIMVDTLVTAYRSKVMKVAGSLSGEEMLEVDAALALVLGLGEPR
jgi:mRNA interferase MazF